MGKQFAFLEYLMVGPLPWIGLWFLSYLLLNNKDTDIISVFDMARKVSETAITRQSELLNSASCWNGFQHACVWLVKINAKIGVPYYVYFA